MSLTRLHSNKKSFLGVRMDKQTFSGTLYAHSETGFEATPWALNRNVPGEWFHLIRPGDTLKVFDDDERVLFDATILIGEGRGGFGDTYWYPKGIRKNRWLSFFMGEKRATLTRAVPDAVADMVSRVMTTFNYLTHIESHSSPLKDCVEVVVACYFPDERRKPTRIKLWFGGGILKDVRPI